MSSSVDHYEGLADWYDTTFSGYAKGPSALVLARLLGSGEGLCLDVGCGTGLHFAAIESTGRRVIGVDLSSDQLTVAQGRSSKLVQASAASLPFRDEQLLSAVSTFTHADVTDFAELVAEVARVLTPRGRFVYVGTHPCFVSHAATRTKEGVSISHEYAEAGFHPDSPSFRANGLRARVGEWHWPLDAFLMTFVDAGLRLSDVEEVQGGFGLGEADDARFSGVPGMFAVVATKD